MKKFLVVAMLTLSVISMSSAAIATEPEGTVSCGGGKPRCPDVF